MTPELVKAFFHQIVEYAKTTKWGNSPLAVALLSGTEATFDALIDDWLRTAAGQAFLAAANKK